MENNRTEKGKFIAGNKGKPKGAMNKITRAQKEWVEWVLELAEERVEESIAKLKPKELIDMCVTLQEFVRPKLQRVNLEVGNEDKEIRSITFKVVRSCDPANAASSEKPISE
jgi:hypothetical protein